MDDITVSSASVRWSRTSAVAAALALIVLGLAWELWLAPTGRGTLALKVLPLALALPGLLRMRLYTYRWLSLAVWLYVAEGAVRATTERGATTMLALLEVVLSVVLFAACCVQVRSRLSAGAAARIAARATP
jgi:uncharacterized membrane protein